VQVQKQALAGATDENSKKMANLNVFSLCAYIVKTQGLGGAVPSLPGALPEPLALLVLPCPPTPARLLLPAPARPPRAVYRVGPTRRPGLYRGLPTELFRGVLSGALLLFVKEKMDVISTRMLLSA
jgi:hypothetical protein